MEIHDLHQDAPSRFIKLAQMIERLGISKSEAFRRIHTVPGFPQPIRMGARCVVYSSAEVEAYMQDCIAKRDQQRAA
jgi:predicted DNA-binding transcriptional regulator AlpA